MGPIPQLKLDELFNDDNYPVTKVGFNGLVNHFIRSLCLDENAKGTLKQSIERGNWIKPEDMEIQEHHQKVIHLFKRINQVPGFHCGEMTEMEKYRLYVATFPTQWAKQFILVQKDSLMPPAMTQLMSIWNNKRKKQIKLRRRRKKKKVTTIDTPIKEMEVIGIIASTKSIAEQERVQLPSAGSIPMENMLGAIAT